MYILTCTYTNINTSVYVYVLGKDLQKCRISLQTSDNYISTKLLIFFQLASGKEKDWSRIRSIRSQYQTKDSVKISRIRYTVSELGVIVNVAQSVAIHILFQGGSCGRCENRDGRSHWKQGRHDVILTCLITLSL